jgi:hypothetical protein
VGLHPYRGDGLILFMILCRVKRANYVRKFMQIVENSATVLDFSTALGMYMKVAGVLMSGVEALLDLGDIQPLIGLREPFGQDAGGALESGYLALINMPQPQLNVKELWVREGQLVYGKTLEEAKPFRQADYVLYSIISEQERTDETTLPFYPLWERIVQESMVCEENSWKRAKADMLTLYQNMVLSPDLTSGQADELYNKYINEMKKLYDKAVARAELGPVEGTKPSEEESRLRQATEILDM